MKRLLLTGASGFLGWNICKIAQNEWRIHGIANRADFRIQRIVVHKLDLNDQASLRKTFSEINPDTVIHTAAISDANYCQQHARETYSINVAATALLSELCAAKKIPFVFTSSDLVFDGKKGSYKETDEVNPVSEYGEQKAEAERFVLQHYPEAAICRMPLMIGDGGPMKKGYLQLFCTKIKSGETLKLFIDEYRSPLGGISAAKGLLHALKNFKGVYHLGGKERLSRFELGEKIAEAFRIPHSQLIPAKQNEMKMSAPRPADVSLDSDKAFKEGFKPELIGDELVQLTGLGR